METASIDLSSITLRQSIYLSGRGLPSFSIAQPAVEYIFIHITQRGDFGPGQTRIFADMIKAAASNSANRHANAVVCTEDALGLRDQNDSAQRGQTCCSCPGAGFQKIATSDFGRVRHEKLSFPFLVIFQQSYCID